MSDHRLGRPSAHPDDHRPASGLVEAPPRVQGPRVQGPRVQGPRVQAPPWDQEQPRAQGSEPRPGRHANPGGPRRRSRAVLIGGGALVAVAGIGVGLAVTGGNHPSASLSSGGTAPTDAPTAAVSASASASGSPAPWASESCPNQLSSWRGTGAAGQLQAVATNVTILLQAATPLETDLAHGTAPAANVTALRSAANSLGSATRAAGRNVIPACISGAHQAEVAGLASLGSAVTGFENALRAIGSGDDPTARGNIRTAIPAMQSGSADMAKASVDLSRYGAK
jgi:hypothetical protein